MNINYPVDLAKDAYAFLSDSTRVSSLAQSTYQELKLEMQSMREVAAKNNKTLLTAALLTATVAGIYLYGSELVTYMEKACRAQKSAPVPKAKAPSPSPSIPKPTPAPQAKAPSPSPIPNKPIEPTYIDQVIANYHAMEEKAKTFFSERYKPGATYQPALKAGKKATEGGLQSIRSNYEPLYPLLSKASQVWKNLPGLWDFLEAVRSVLPNFSGKALDECVMNIVKDPKTTASRVINKCTPSIFSSIDCNGLRKQVRSVRNQIHPDKIDGNQDPFKLFGQFVTVLSEKYPSCRLKT